MPHLIAAGAIQISRQAHLEWCKTRAHEYLVNGDVQNAYASMASDLNKHPETQGHPAITLGMMLMMSGHLSSVPEMRKFIDGFN
jgi:hypothetical protein